MASAKVLVVGNEKGGSGKSTTAMHLAVGLAIQGYRVGVIDGDVRQGTMTRFLTNRASYIQSSGHDLVLPTLLGADPDQNIAKWTTEEQLSHLEGLIATGRPAFDILLIDTPGSAGAISERLHSYADILITPMNDSFVDLDVLARVDPGSMTITAPSNYADMVWRQKLERAKRDGASTDWVIMRNRLSSLDSHNRREMERLLSGFAKRIGFRFLPGFGERVIYRELFLNGLTIMDIKETGGGLNMSHVSARQEVRRLISELKLPVPLQKSA